MEKAQTVQIELSEAFMKETSENDTMKSLYDRYVKQQDHIDSVQ